MDNTIAAAKPNYFVLPSSNDLKAAIDLQEKANRQWNETFNRVPALADQVSALAGQVDTLTGLLGELIIQVRDLAGKVREVTDQAR